MKSVIKLFLFGVLNAIVAINSKIAIYYIFEYWLNSYNEVIPEIIYGVILTMAAALNIYAMIIIFKNKKLGTILYKTTVIIIGFLIGCKILFSGLNNGLLYGRMMAEEAAKSNPGGLVGIGLVELLSIFIYSVIIIASIIVSIIVSEYKKRNQSIANVN